MGYCCARSQQVAVGPVAPWPELLWHTPSPEPGENPIGGAFGNSPFNMSVEISFVVSALCLKVLLFSFYFQVWYETGRKHSVWKRRCGGGNYMYCAFLSLSTACPLLVSHGIDSILLPITVTSQVLWCLFLFSSCLSPRPRSWYVVHPGAA